MPQHDELRHDTGTIAKIDFSYDDNDDPFNTTRFNGLGKKYDVSNSVDAKCGEGGFKPELSKTWPHVKVLVENTGDCEVTVTLAEGITKNFPTYTGNTNVKATFKVGKKEPGKDPHNNNAQTDGVNMIIFECSESDPDDFGNECKLEYKIRAY